MKNLKFIMLLVFSIGSINLYSAIPQFNGIVDGNWMNPANWDCNCLPMSGDTVIINPPAPNNGTEVYIPTGETINVMRIWSYNEVGSFTIRSGATLNLNSTDVAWPALNMDMQLIVDGTLNINGSLGTGIELENQDTIRGIVNIDNTGGVGLRYGAKLYISGTINFGVNIGGNWNMISQYLSDTLHIDTTAVIDLSSTSIKGIGLTSSATMIVDGTINFPSGSMNTAIESNGKIINNSILDFNPDPSTGVTTLINQDTLINFGTINLPVINGSSLLNAGLFLNDTCGFVSLRGRLAGLSGELVNIGIIHSPNTGLASHTYSDFHNFGIVADPGHRFNTAFTTNAGISTKIIQFENCQTNYIDNVTDGWMNNVSMSNFYLDTSLTVLCGVYDMVVDTVGLMENTIGVSKFFVEITGDNACSIITAIHLQSWLSIAAYYLDEDGDGYGVNEHQIQSCAPFNEGYSDVDGDCDDTKDYFHPGASELCDGLDNDCDSNTSSEVLTTSLFNGSSSNDWHTAANWSTGVIPDYCSDVVIPNGQSVTSDPASLSYAHTIQVMSGGIAVLDGETRVEAVGSNTYGIINEGRFNMAPYAILKVNLADTAIINLDSMDMSQADVEIFNAKLGISNRLTARAKFSSLNLHDLETGIINKGTFWFDSEPMFQGFLSLNNIVGTIIDNYGTFYHYQGFYSLGSEGLSSFIWKNWGNFHFGKDEFILAEFPTNGLGLWNKAGAQFMNNGVINANGSLFIFESASDFTVEPGATLVIEEHTPLVYNPITNKIWMDRNIGASNVATSSLDPDGYGDLFQWGRAADGHENRNSPIHNTSPAYTALPNQGNDWDGKFITYTPPFNNQSWLNSPDTELWQGVDGFNNVCPEGFRIPTSSEWIDEINTWTTQDAAGAFNSSLKLPLAGKRVFNTAATSGIGYYWTSNSFLGDRAFSIRINNTGTFNIFPPTKEGRSVRCIRE